MNGTLRRRLRIVYIKADKVFTLIEVYIVYYDFGIGVGRTAVPVTVAIVGTVNDYIAALVRNRGIVYKNLEGCLRKRYFSEFRSKFFLKYQKHPVVESVFSGLRPAVVGLLASAALVLMNTENFGSPKDDTYTFVISCIIFLAAFVGTHKYKVNPILMIVICGIAGALLY